MTNERLKKALATKKARKQEFDAQTIKIDNEWKIVRIDALNWQIRHKGKCPGNRENFYGTLVGAFEALPATLLQADAKDDVQHVLAVVNSLVANARAAILRLDKQHGE